MKKIQQTKGSGGHQGILQFEINTGNKPRQIQPTSLGMKKGLACAGENTVPVQGDRMF